MGATDHLIATRIAESAAVITALQGQSNTIGRVAHALATSLAQGKKLLAAGNGGSAAEAMHLCEELTGKYRAPRRALPAICLNADGTLLTCVGNDWSFAEIFSRQVEAFAQPGDLLVLFSTSGNSENLLRAADAMHARHGQVLGILGRDGGKLFPRCDHAIVVPANDTGHVQEAHQVILHILLECVEAAIA